MIGQKLIMLPNGTAIHNYVVSTYFHRLIMILNCTAINEEKKKNLTSSNKKLMSVNIICVGYEKRNKKEKKNIEINN